jgi:gamma-glutamyltranspeptidase
MILNLVENYDLSSLGYHSPDHLHWLIEAKKVAFVDRTRYISDPDAAKIPVKELLSKDYAASRRALIDRHHAADSSAILPGRSAGIQSTSASSMKRVMRFLIHRSISPSIGVVAGKRESFCKSGAYFPRTDA